MAKGMLVEMGGKKFVVLSEEALARLAEEHGAYVNRCGVAISVSERVWDTEVNGWVNNPPKPIVDVPIEG